MTDDLKQLMRENYLAYASYVILDRAIPNVIDGLKPVQRRILHTLRSMHDGKLHKVANVVGQTMAYHPHGDAPIYEALVNIANKGFLLKRQGNFGNPHTGDPAAAGRYIETALSSLAVEVLFNPDLTESIPSYDGRNQEPVTLPAKIPLVLMQGAEGIAVGMSTRILPHNFKELLEAQIDLLEGKEVAIYPDFLSGGSIDISDYDKGRGKVRMRAKLCVKDPKTVIVEEICPGTTTESVINSIDEAAKKGKIKIDSIHDYTSEKVEIEICLPRGHYAQDLIPALYAFTQCEVSISLSPIVIRDQLPWETNVNEILAFHVEKLQGYLKRELEIKKERLLEKVFQKTLEQIFIENKLYKKLETVKAQDKLQATVAASLTPYHPSLLRKPTKEDIEKLLNIPIRRISKFDLDKNEEEIAAINEEIEKTERSLKRMKAFTIQYLKKLIKDYGHLFPRRTKIEEMETIDKKEVDKKKVSVGFDAEKGVIGTKVRSTTALSCSPHDKILAFFTDGTYKVFNVPDKVFLNINGRKTAYLGLADRKTTFQVIYKDPKTSFCYVKRFIVKSFILDKEYRYFEEKMKLELITTEQSMKVSLQFKSKPRLKTKSLDVNLEDFAVKSVSSKGVKLARHEVKRVQLKSAEAKKRSK